MSKKQIITPVLLSLRGKKYKLMYLNFSGNDSIYLIFPSKKGYKIRARKDISIPVVGEKTVQLDRLKESYVMPKVSFHSGKNIVHINCFGKKYEYDKPILNMSAMQGILLFPFCQVVIPNNIDYFDVYKEKEGYVNPLIFEVKKNFSKSLSIEFWVHNVGSYIDPKDVPFIDKRGNIIGYFRYSDINLKKYTCTIIASEQKGTNAGIIVANFNDIQPFVFELVP